MWLVSQRLQQSREVTTGKRSVKRLDSVGASEKWQPPRVKRNTRAPLGTRLFSQRAPNTRADPFLVPLSHQAFLFLLTRS